MRPPKFEYYRPASVDEAVQMLATHDNARALAGGHSLIPAMNLRLAQPDILVDLRELDELRGITVTNAALRIGALCTHAEIAAYEEIRQHCPALASAAAEIGDPQVRNWGTIGGNLAHADPAADLPIAVLAYGGTIHIQGPDGERSATADDFFIDLFMVDLMPGELIVAVELPITANMHSAYAKYPHPASHYALVGVCVVLEMDGDRCRSARVAVGGSVPKAIRSPSAEALLAGSALDNAAIEAAANALVEDIAADIMGDIFAPEDYRKTMTAVYFKRAVRAALLTK
jgi:aerobic carbon-monoxide dehydrogenase medium subunit